jgi:flagellar motor switch/type III secretory pathway protein FliN
MADEPATAEPTTAATAADALAVEKSATAQVDAVEQAIAAETASAAPLPRDLPPFTRSLLRVKVPVMVTLATKKQSLGQIVELGPGSIINFDKSCDEMLELEASGHRVAQGEAVKIGDKFGLRVVSIILPDERFRSLHGSK